MLAISRSLMNSPKLLMLDEPSLGLAPQIVEQILEIILNLKQAGLTILLIEQNARAARQIVVRGRATSAAAEISWSLVRQVAAPRPAPPRPR